MSREAALRVGSPGPRGWTSGAPASQQPSVEPLGLLTLLAGGPGPQSTPDQLNKDRVGTHAPNACNCLASCVEFQVWSAERGESMGETLEHWVCIPRLSGRRRGMWVASPVPPPDFPWLRMSCL